ncbi:MAG TPA: DUF481 domain-containing protein [Gemmataceae bacterium]|nr:DUF481 domain-containing protein [Gemmataceae bacterium]
MTRALGALTLALVAFGPAAAQESPFGLPKPLGGPIVGPDGKVMSALDKTPSEWTGGLELGLSGAEGNDRILKLRTGLDVQYDTADDFMVANLLYILTRVDNGIVEQKGFALVRNELPVDDAWAWYVQGQLEYDESRNIDFRTAGHNGFSMTVFRTGNSLMKVRAGAGAAYETGKPVNDWVAEGQAGGDIEYSLTARSKFCAAVDYYPDLQDFSHYRVRARAWLDLLIDPDLNAYLRLGVFNRYDSNPLGSLRNDLDYYMSLLIRF